MTDTEEEKKGEKDVEAKLISQPRDMRPLKLKTLQQSQSQ
jgi:hypothetical protein